ncbi:MAG: hypothetical protein ABEI77_07620 [Halorientalis sp.]
MSKSEVEGWEELAEELHENGNIPEQIAEVAILKLSEDADLSHSDVVEISSVLSRGNVTNALERYSELYKMAEWLVENGPEPDR